MILQLKQVVKQFQPLAQPPIEVLKGVDLQVHTGETIAIVGQSGSGKSTLLSLLAGLDQPTSGQILLRDQDLAQMDESTLTQFRAENIGIIFQQFHLMTHLTALENISLPLEMFRDPKAQEKAKGALEQVELSHRQDHFPYQLSGGECQRVAIARALVIQPAILLADEPTGNLDHQTGEHIVEALFHLVKAHHMTLILVTHNEQLAHLCKRRVVLQNGVLA